MAKTTSWAFPNMIDPVRNCINVAEDNKSITNRTKLLLLTQPTELYNNPTFGVGLKRYLWQYNTENTKAQIQDRIREQLRVFEPCVDPDASSFADGLLFSEGVESNTPQSYNQLKMTIGLVTIYGDELNIDLNDLQNIIDNANSDMN